MYRLNYFCTTINCDSNNYVKTNLCMNSCDGNGPEVSHRGPRSGIEEVPVRIYSQSFEGPIVLANQPKIFRFVPADWNKFGGCSN
jgi:hypothetical protein